jgi:hypothetical protein
MRKRLRSQNAASVTMLIGHTQEQYARPPTTT